MNKLTPLTPTISAIKLPDGTTETSIYHQSPSKVFLDWWTKDGAIEKLELPPGFTRILGPVSELTPEQKAEIVELCDYSDGEPYDQRPYFQGYPDYTAGKDESGLWITLLDDPEESFATLLQSKRVYTVNPLGPEPLPPRGDNAVWDGEEYRKAHSAWKEAQQYVGNWILIEKEV